jgi:hypothetical protein
MRKRAEGSSVMGYHSEGDTGMEEEEEEEEEEQALGDVFS